MKKEIGKRIKSLREAMGFVNDQTGFAERLGVTQTTVSSWESGVSRPSGTRLSSFERLGVNVEWLRTGRGDMFVERSALSTEIAEFIAVYKKLKPEQRALLNSVAAQFLK